MNNINKMFDGLGGIASLPGLGVGIGGAGALNPLGAALGLGANDPLAAGTGLLGTGMMSDGSSSGGNPAQVSGQTPDYSYVDNLPSTVPDMQIPNVSVPDSVQAVEPKEEFNYSKMLESISKATGKLGSAEDSAASAPAMGVNRGSMQGGQAPVMYGNMIGASPGMQAIQDNRPMMGGPQNIEQLLNAISGR